CRYAPLELTVDTHRVNDTVALGTHSPTALAWLWLPASEGQRASLLFPRNPHPDSAPSCAAETLRGERDFSALLVLESPINAEREGLTLVVRGLSFRRPNTVLGFPMACGVVSAPFLRKNISHTDLAENEDYQQLIEELRRQVRELVLRRCDNPLPASSAAARHLAQALPALFGKDLPGPARRWLHSFEIRQKSSEAAAFERLLAGLSDFEPAAARQAEQELGETQLYFLRLSWTESDASPKRGELAERLLRLPHLEGYASADELELISAAQHWSGKAPAPWPERTVAWNLHRRALGLRLAGRWDEAGQLHEQDKETAWGPYLLGELAHSNGQDRLAVAGFDLAATRAKWGFLHDACASLFSSQKRPYDAFQARVRAYEARRGSAAEMLWVQWVYDQARGACSFPEWVGWCARAGLARYREMTSEEERLYRLSCQQRGMPALEPWRKASLGIQTRPLATPASRFVFWKFYEALRSREQHVEADALLCRRLLRASFRLEGGKAVAWEPPTSIL
ncbi:MAG: hypothetical protein KC910_30100, partial [Candidatus Eremiobacteraeota bacterium]|nr:hypothetical protein [Candidatus Eremiobacteraeota bacterium]